MRSSALPWSVLSCFPLALALLNGAAPSSASAAPEVSSIQFTGAGTTLSKRLASPTGVAVDSAGNVYIADSGQAQIYELPRTATGYGTRITVPTTDLQGTFGVAVDHQGNVIVSERYGDKVVEVPRAGSGFGAQITVDSAASGPAGVAVDSAGDVFIISGSDAVEIPRTSDGFGPRMVLPATGLERPSGIAVDKDGNVFIADPFHYRVVELPKTDTGYGAQKIAVKDTGADGIAVDDSGDLFVAHYGIVKYPRLGATFGPGVALPFTGADSVAANSTGDVFGAEIQNDSVLKIQTGAVNFDGVNSCPPNRPTLPCNLPLTLAFRVNADVSLGTPKVLTGGQPDLDFTLGAGSTCTGALVAGSTCTVRVIFQPLSVGKRSGTVEITGENGSVLATTTVYGLGVAVANQPPKEASVTFAAAQKTLPATGLTYMSKIAVDEHDGGLLLVEGTSLVKLEKTPSGYSQQKSLFHAGSNSIESLAVDTNQNVFITYARK